ncbi:MAG: pyridoxine 5'-phosphate synthase [Gammaproteobacteria bacterium]|nr:pyridoxine 5'-phosphate synthase [Gammaproteobacteria bacterium]
MHPLELGVNIDHVATLRQARRTVYPEPLAAAMAAVAGGADSITVHLREDRRHIQERDVRLLRERLQVPLNLEMAVTGAMLELAAEVRPAFCCLVPERREELTTEGGLDVAGQVARIRDACGRLAAAGIRVALFIDPVPGQVDGARECGAPVIELHTGAFADAADTALRQRELDRIRSAAVHAERLGLHVNAGHGLNYENVGAIAVIPPLRELNIGHSIVAESVFTGMTAAVRRMKALLREAQRS